MVIVNDGAAIVTRRSLVAVGADGDPIQAGLQLALDWPRLEIASLALDVNR